MDHCFLTLRNGEAPLCTLQHLKAKFDEALSNFAFSFNLRCCTKEEAGYKRQVTELV
jgi:hypothetical protein